MKKSFGKKGAWIAGLALAMCLGLAGRAAAQDESHPARVLSLRGSARASSDHATWHKLEIGSMVVPGTLIQTAGNSVVNLVLAKPMTGDKQDAGVVQVGANSVLQLNKLSSEHSGDDLVEHIEMDLQVGEIQGTAGKLATGGTYEIKFEKGIVGVRGAAYRMTASGFVTVTAGEAVVVVAKSDGSTLVKVVDAGHQFNPRTESVDEISSTPSQTPSAEPTEPKSQSPGAVAPAVIPDRHPLRPL